MGEMPPNLYAWKIRGDKRYLYCMVLAVDSGHCDDDLARAQPGVTSTARWLTTASRILRFYVTQTQPSNKLRDLATFIVRVYAPFWFLVKSQPLAIHGSRNVFMVMVTDPDAMVRADGYDKIFEAGLNATGRTRQFREAKHQPYINYRSTTYSEMIDWTRFNITEPQTM